MSLPELRPTTRRSALRLKGDNVCVFERNGVYQARIRLGNGRYLWRSLKTADEQQAISVALRLHHSLEFRKQNGLPISSRKFEQVIAEYVAFRELQHQQGRTSSHMLRQIKRVVKFWHEYLGGYDVEAIGNKQLSGYVEWRKGYYSRMPILPKNAKLHPTDKTLQWEIALGKSIVKWAHEQGYRGAQQLPTFSFYPKKRRVRPAFELFEYRRLLRALLQWQRDCPNEIWLHSRVLLTDYVLVLASSGMRAGEANNLKLRDVETFADGRGRRNYRFKVRGKTGERDIILRAIAAKSVDRLLGRRPGARPDDWLFAMRNGTRVITLIDQFDAVLKLGGIVRNSHGQKFTIYSLRHFYAVQSLRRGIGVFELARNMGTSVQIIQDYYGKHATAMTFATRLGG